MRTQNAKVNNKRSRVKTGRVNKVISEKEFAKLDGKPKKIGGKNPNSMAQRLLSIIPKTGGINVDEALIAVTRLETDTEAKLKMALAALTYDKVKTYKENKQGERVSKVCVKYDKTGNAYFRLNDDYATAK